MTIAIAGSIAITYNFKYFQRQSECIVDTCLPLLV